MPGLAESHLHWILGRTSSEEAARQQVFDITLPISCLQETWRLSQRQIRKTSWWPSVWKHLLLRRKGSCTQAEISLRRNIALQHVFRPNARFQHLNMLLSWGCQLGNCFSQKFSLMYAAYEVCMGSGWDCVIIISVWTYGPASTLTTFFIKLSADFSNAIWRVMVLRVHPVC